MLTFELEDAIRAFELAIKNQKGMRMTRAAKTIVKGERVVTQDDVLTPHRVEQINRILIWAHHHWDTFEPELHKFLARLEAVQKREIP
jgi:hypothetical protein